MEKSIQLKSVFELSVRITNTRQRRECRPSPVVTSRPLGVPDMGTSSMPPGMDGRSARSGTKLATYNTTRTFCEHGNLNSSADAANVGKLPSPAMTRVRDGALVVVRARENRVHGEGGQ